VILFYLKSGLYYFFCLDGCGSFTQKAAPSPCVDIILNVPLRFSTRCFTSARSKPYPFSPFVPLLDVALPRSMLSIYIDIYSHSRGFCLYLQFYPLSNPGQQYTVVIGRKFYRVRDPVICNNLFLKNGIVSDAEEVFTVNLTYLFMACDTESFSSLSCQICLMSLRVVKSGGL
jgi:hypothetical protein